MYNFPWSDMRAHALRGVYASGMSRLPRRLWAFVVALNARRPAGIGWKRALCVGCLALLVGGMLPTTGRCEGSNKSIVVKTAKLNINFQYPVFGNKAIDDDIEEWARQTVESFQSEFAEGAQDIPYEMKGTYRLIRASDRVQTVVWEVWNFTGGAHGNLDIVAFVYDTKTGLPLDLQNLFGDEQEALNRMSSVSYQSLASTLGSMYSEDMLRAGTTPDLDNFACVAPTADGVRIFFQPYQVAPWAAGPQEVNIPLVDLTEASPHLEFWGR